MEICPFSIPVCVVAEIRILPEIRILQEHRELSFVPVSRAVKEHKSCQGKAFNATCDTPQNHQAEQRGFEEWKQPAALQQQGCKWELISPSPHKRLKDCFFYFFFASPRTINAIFKCYKIA